jgi:hypothetical protein
MALTNLSFTINKCHNHHLHDNQNTLEAPSQGMPESPPQHSAAEQNMSVLAIPKDDPVAPVIENEPTPSDKEYLTDEEDMTPTDLWEEELSDHLLARKEMQTWEQLREDMKGRLHKGKQMLPLSQINQYLIIQNFATLRIKGLSRITASNEIAQQWHEGEGIYFAHRVHAPVCHYQVFEQLPKEMHGGAQWARSLLYDEGVKLTCQAWLTSQPAGQVTPLLF